MEQAVEVLSSIRRINKNDAKHLLANYGSLQKVILSDDYEEFLNIEGIGQSKIEAIATCFRGNFNHQASAQNNSTKKSGETGSELNQNNGALNNSK